MPIRVVVFNREGDAKGMAALQQIRAMVAQLRADAHVLIITDESQFRMNGVENPPAVVVDGSMISNGWVPSRAEIERALRNRMAAIETRQRELGG